MEKINNKEVKSFLLDLQESICKEIEDKESSAKFRAEKWDYREKGGGISKIMENGKVIEKAGVNFSHIYGSKMPSSASKKKSEVNNMPFEAMGVSIVVHPKNPHIPTTHANIRMFTAKDKNKKDIWWFGGGMDLTPYYPIMEDVVQWHKTCKNICDRYDALAYSKFKHNCDEYFFLQHRNETRGVGGIFFDDLNEWGFDNCFNFIKDVGMGFKENYGSILKKRMNEKYSKKERDFQLYRRGRYVEFNLLYDRGTKFGLQSNGRTESILMSMPPVVKWIYNLSVDPNDKENEIQEYLKPREWL